MVPVQILYSEGILVLRAQKSELFILPEHVSALEERSDHTEFQDYFLKQALVNRSARKLFQAWGRRDVSLWSRLYRTLHERKDQPEEKNEEEIAP